MSTLEYVRRMPPNDHFKVWSKYLMAYVWHENSLREMPETSGDTEYHGHIPLITNTLTIKTQYIICLCIVSNQKWHVSVIKNWPFIQQQILIWIMDIVHWPCGSFKLFEAHSGVSHQSLTCSHWASLSHNCMYSNHVTKPPNCMSFPYLLKLMK